MVAYTAEELRELASVADRTLGAADDDGDSDDDRERERKKGEPFRLAAHSVHLLRVHDASQKLPENRTSPPRLRRGVGCPRPP